MSIVPSLALRRRTGFVAPIVTALAALTGPSNSLSALPPPPAELGVWLDDTGKGAVEIRTCGNKLCGHIVWLKEPTDAQGLPLVDGYNPNPNQRRRPICGLQVLGDLERQDDGAWDAGWVYDPKVGKAYDVEIRLSARDRLTVKGYKGLKFLSKTFVWTRAPGDLPRCAEVAASDPKEVNNAKRAPAPMPPPTAAKIIPPPRR